MPQVIPQGRGRFRCDDARRGEEVQLDCEHVNEQHGEKEAGNGHEGEGKDGAAIVQQGVWAQSSQHAQADAYSGRDKQANDHQFNRLRQGPPDQFRHGVPRLNAAAITHVPLQDASEPLDIAYGQGLIEAKFMAKVLDLLLSHRVTFFGVDQHQDRIAGGSVVHGEVDERDTQSQRNYEQQTTDDVFRHNENQEGSFRRLPVPGRAFN